jgi:hypothetical protein
MWKAGDESLEARCGRRKGAMVREGRILAKSSDISRHQ